MMNFIPVGYLMEEKIIHSFVSIQEKATELTKDMEDVYLGVNGTNIQIWKKEIQIGFSFVGIKKEEPTVNLGH